MYSYLRGVFRGQPSGAGSPLIVEAAGIGYEVVVPPIVEQEVAVRYTLEQPILLYVAATSTRDQPWPEVLFGFLRPEEKAFWQLLRSVPRMGGRGAAKVLTVPIPTIAQAIQDENKVFLDGLAGVTLEGAERMIATLRKKVAPFTLAAPAARGLAGDPRDEIRSDSLELLVSLGVKRLDAQREVDNLLRSRDDLASVQDLLTEYFRSHNSGRVS